MKKLLFLLIVIIGLTNISCDDKVASGKDDWYYIYISGDYGKTVQISYLEREKGVEFANKNVIVDSTVTLPFFAEIHTVDFIDNINYDSYLEVKSQNDSTTRAIIFDEDLKLEDQNCKVFFVWSSENAQNDYSYCKDMAKDSVLRYLKSINYPCYIEFAKSETSKKVRLYDWWFKDSK